jgi:hypothetical protein
VRALVAVVAVWSGAAVAEPKPVERVSIDVARDVVKAWIDAGSGDDLLVLSAASLYTADYEDQPDKGCKPATSTTAAAKKQAAACMSGHLELDTELVAWTKDSPKQLAFAMKDDKARIAKLAATGVVIWRHEPCAGQGDDRLFAIVVENGKPKVAAAIAQNYSCGE